MVLYAIESVAILVMTLDFIVRLITCRNRSQMMSLYTAIDLLSILPCIAQVIYWYAAKVEESEHNSTKRMTCYIICSLRIFRVFRMLKLVKQIRVLQLLLLSLKASKRELMMLVGIVSVLATIYGSIIYYTEMFEDTFENIGHGIWWAIITMTTVGYGDYYPKGAFGCTFGALVAVSGILILALPIPVIANHFNTYYSIFNLIEKVKVRKVEEKQETVKLQKENIIVFDVENKQTEGEMEIEEL